MPDNEIIQTPERELLEDMDFRHPVSLDEGSVDFDFGKWFSDLVGAFRFSDIIQNIKKGSHFVVQIPEQFQKAFAAGELLMTENSDTGKLWPSLYKLLPNGKHEFVCNLPVKLEEFTQGNPLQDFTANIQNIQLQKQIQALKKEVREVKEIVRRIEQGQTDDRIGLLISGRDQLYLALENPDPEARTRELELARAGILNARGQILRTLITRAGEYKPIPGKGLKQYWRRLDSKYALEREKDFNFIQDYFRLYVEATKLLAASYEIGSDAYRAQAVIKNAVRELDEIDFSRVATIKNLHPEFDYFFENCPDKLDSEGQECLESVSRPDCLRFDVAGDQLLEVFNVREKVRV